jgi:hypothetical protein
MFTQNWAKIRIAIKFNIQYLFITQDRIDGFREVELFSP